VGVHGGIRCAIFAGVSLRGKIAQKLIDLVFGSSLPLDWLRFPCSFTFLGVQLLAKLNRT